MRRSPFVASKGKALEMTNELWTLVISKTSALSVIETIMQGQCNRCSGTTAKLTSHFSLQGAKGARTWDHLHKAIMEEEAKDGCSHACISSNCLLHPIVYNIFQEEVGNQFPYWTRSIARRFREVHGRDGQSSELQHSLDKRGMHQVIDVEDFDDTMEDLDGVVDYLSDRREE
ncbi:hypothetical protein L7F22_030403 [Adiantum nelumboides]|nr:hypothetical protein [Adiantum nelumboides]